MPTTPAARDRERPETNPLNPNQRATATTRRAAQIVAEGVPVGPREHPCVCGRPRAVHGGQHATGGVKGTPCRRYRLDPAWDLAYQALDAQHATLGTSLRRAEHERRAQHYRSNPRKPGEWSIGASDAGTCPKKIEYRNKPPEGFVPAWEDTREADAGTMLHEGITARLRLIYPWREYAGKVRIPGLDRDSEFDSYDPITGEVEDYKTAGRWRWDRIGEDGPEETVWDQVMLYGYAVAATGRVVRTVRLSYYHREKGHDETFVRPYDEQQAKAALDRLLGYATNLDLGIPLPKTGTGPTTDALCRRCFARDHCWNIERAAQVNRSPESLTILGEKPDLDAMVWAIEEKVRAARLTSEAKKATEEAKALMVGVEPGRYGDYEGYESRTGGGPDHKAHAEALAEVIRSHYPGEPLPDPDEIPVPEKPKIPYIRWGKVRKATLERERRERAALTVAEDADQ